MRRMTVPADDPSDVLGMSHDRTSTLKRGRPPVTDIRRLILGSLYGAKQKQKRARGCLLGLRRSTYDGSLIACDFSEELTTTSVKSDMSVGQELVQ